MRRTAAGQAWPTRAPAVPPASEHAAAPRGRSATPARGPATVQPLEPRRLFSIALTDGFGTVAADGNDLAFDSNGALHRVWRDRGTHALLHAVRQPDQSWGPVRTVDSRAVGGEMSLVVDSTGRPAVSYHDRLNGDLRFAWFANRAWHNTLVDAGGDVGDYNALLRHSSGRHYIAYRDRTNLDLKLAEEFFPGVWTTRTLDSAGDVGGYASIAEGARKSVAVAYSDNTGGRLKLAASTSTGDWTTAVVDSGVPGGVRDVDLVTASGGVLLVAYNDAGNGRLKTAVQTNATSWYRWALNAGDNGHFASVYVPDGGAPAVLHHDRASGTVDVVNFGEPLQSEPVAVALAGEHLSAAVNGAGTPVFSRVDPTTGLLRTTTTAPYRHVPSADAGKRFVHWETIGGANQNVSIRRVGWDLDVHGWQGYVDKRVKLLRAIGTERILLHNPFGTLPEDEVFQFDQAIHAEDAGLHWLTQGFAPAWRPVTAAGVEVIAYIGMLRDDPDFTALTDMKQYMARVMRSIKPLLDAGVSIGLDSITGSNHASREYMVVRMLRDSGVKIYNENRPPADYPHWHDYNGVYYDEGFIDSEPTNNPSQHWAAPNGMLTGEILRLLEAQPGQQISLQGWPIANSINILRAGHTVSINMPGLYSLGYTTSQIYDMAVGNPGPGPAPEPSGPPLPTPALRPGSTSGGATKLEPIAAGLFGSTPID